LDIDPGGHFCQKAGKNLEKKLFTKEIINKKSFSIKKEKTWGESKIR
jgi:hypothetical protein